MGGKKEERKEGREGGKKRKMEGLVRETELIFTRVFRNNVLGLFLTVPEFS